MELEIKKAKDIDRKIKASAMDGLYESVRCQEEQKWVSVESLKKILDSEHPEDMFGSLRICRKLKKT